MATPRLSPPVPARPTLRVPITPKPDNVAKPNVGSSVENILLGNTPSHEQAEHPSNASLRLETAVRFTGVLMETEDMAATTRYWKGRQEHAEAKDFYAFLRRQENEVLTGVESPVSATLSAQGGPETAVIANLAITENQETPANDAVKENAAMESTPKVSGSENTAIESNAITGGSKTRVETAVIAKRKPPPPPPPRSRSNRPGGSNNPVELSGESVPVVLQTSPVESTPISSQIAPVELPIFSEPSIQKSYEAPVLPPKVPIDPQIGTLELDSTEKSPTKSPKNSSSTPILNSGSQNSPSNNNPFTKSSTNNPFSQSSNNNPFSQSPMSPLTINSPNPLPAWTVQSPLPQSAVQPQQQGMTPSSAYSSNVPLSILREWEQMQSAASTGSSQYDQSFTDPLNPLPNPHNQIPHLGNVQQYNVESTSVNQSYQNINQIYGNGRPSQGFQSTTGLTQNPHAGQFGYPSTGVFFPTGTFPATDSPTTGFSTAATAPVSPTPLPQPIDNVSTPNPTVTPSVRSPNQISLPSLVNTAAIPSSDAAERLQLRSTMAAMKTHTLGSPASIKLGMEYVMPYWATVPAIKYVPLGSNHLKHVLDNLSKPSGLGLAETSEGFSFFHLCIRLSKLELIKELVENGGAVITTVAPKSASLLRNAIWYADENSGVVEYLISKGELINRQIEQGAAPIHQAIAAYNVTAVRALINAGADVNIGFTWAKKDVTLINRQGAGYAEQKVEVMLGILFLLLDAGGRIKPHSDGSIPPALFTGASGFPDVLEVLRSKGVDATYLERLECFGLSAALLFNNESYVKAWIKDGKDVNKPDMFGARPLDNAVALKRHNLVELLRGAGARTKQEADFKAASTRQQQYRNKWSELDDFDDNWSVAGNFDDNGDDEWDRVIRTSRLPRREWHPRWRD
ncbi:hypothetical protein AA313_de0207812 [Arthrobotrys entomopaga]|nr:hypothetical protein AA313_de0207812 [Arthrobotrys entomopaga]